MTFLWTKMNKFILQWCFFFCFGGSLSGLFDVFRIFCKGPRLEDERIYIQIILKGVRFSIFKEEHSGSIWMHIIGILKNIHKSCHIKNIEKLFFKGKEISVDCLVIFTEWGKCFTSQNFIFWWFSKIVLYEVDILKITLWSWFLTDILF